MTTNNGTNDTAENVNITSNATATVQPNGNAATTQFNGAKMLQRRQRCLNEQTVFSGKTFRNALFQQRVDVRTQNETEQRGTVDNADQPAKRIKRNAAGSVTRQKVS